MHHVVVQVDHHEGWVYDDASQLAAEEGMVVLPCSRVHLTVQCFQNLQARDVCSCS